MIADVVAEYRPSPSWPPRCATVRSATINDWGAVAWSAETGFVEAEHRRGLEILDRVGGGDSFASGLIYGLLDPAISRAPSSTALRTARWR